MTAAPISSRTFDLDDQREFAQLSSDWNPMHLDPAFARRTQVGAPVVYGINTLVWAANAALRAYPIKVANIRTRFLLPLYLNEEASISVRRHDAGQIELDVTAAGNRVATIRLSSAPGKTSNDLPPAEAVPPLPSQPASPAFEELAGRRGAVAVADANFDSLHPALTEAIGVSGVKALLATSQIVGMACPGLHSLFSGLDINFRTATAGDKALAYEVNEVDERFRSLQIDIAGYGVRGRLEAFARPAPPVQAAMREIAARTTGNPFAGQRSLVVGGSRGLGEVTAKIIAAGGGRPVITYRDSKREAEHVAAEIARHGGQCDVIRFDALSPAREQLQGLARVDCCYYFATPKIFRRKAELYDPETLRSFLRFYADGLFDLCAELSSSASTTVVFYPSSTAIDEGVSSIAEYAMAKAAGEVLCEYISRFTPGIRIICRRLPRILTDQTATVGVASADNALDAMLPIIYQVQQAARSKSAAPS